MGSLNHIHYHVTSGNTVAYPSTFANLLIVKREGIGYKASEAVPSVETVQGEAVTYERTSFNPSLTPPSGMYFYKTTSYISGVDRIERFSFGTVFDPGYTFTLSADGVTVSYTSVLGDDVDDVRNELINLVNAATYPSGSVAAYTVSSTVLGITILGAFTAFTPGLTDAAYYLYQSGRAVTVDGVDYLISGSESNSAMPAIPAASDPYDYSELTELPSLAAYLNTPGYTPLDYVVTSEGSVDIENFPLDASTPADGETITVGGGLITFLNPFSSDGENILVLYK